MINIEINAKDIIIGDFKLSDYGLCFGYFSYNDVSEDELGMNLNVIEEFIGNSPIPVYLGQKYQNKLSFNMSIVKNPCIYNDLYFTERECRLILRQLTGIRGYQWTKIINDNIDEDIWYRTKVVNISYERVGGHICGIIFQVDCDSQFAWSSEYNITINAKSNVPFYIYNNTDDLNNYIRPYVTIRSSSAGSIALTNKSDSSWTTKIDNLVANEMITIDNKNEIIISDKGHILLLNDFNLKWIRLVPDKNSYICNKDAVIKFKYRVPRKVGLIG